MQQLPAQARAEEAESLRQRLEEVDRHRRGPQPLSAIIPLVLARLGMTVVQSEGSEGAGP